MNINDFKIMYSELIMYFQIIENDLKWIYSFMHKGKINDNYEKINNTNLGFIIKELKELDNSDGKPYISNNDYNFLKQMKNKRNYWCHQAYIDFLYSENGWCLNDFKKVESKLKNDHQRLFNVYQNVEEVKLKAKDDFR